MFTALAALAVLVFACLLGAALMGSGFERPAKGGLPILFVGCMLVLLGCSGLIDLAVSVLL